MQKLLMFRLFKSYDNPDILLMLKVKNQVFEQ